jgi:hypothetical protein
MLHFMDCTNEARCHHDQNLGSCSVDLHGGSSQHCLQVNDLQDAETTSLLHAFGDHKPRRPTVPAGQSLPTLRTQVKDLQDEETGELLRVFEEHQSHSSGSAGGGSSSGDGSHDGRPPPHRSASRKSSR